MNLSATIAKMRAAGMSCEAIVVALECVVEWPEAPEKSGAARRQAAYRERVKKRNETHNVTHNVDNSVTDKEKVSHTLPKEKINTSTRAKAKTDLPNDFQPSPKTWNVADGLGFTERDVFEEIEKMRDWALNADGGKGRKVDWDAALRNWLKRAANDRQKSQAPQRNSLQNAFSAIDAYADAALGRTRGNGPEGSEADAGEFPGLWESAA